ncbi:hypothetical protein ACHAW6_006461 [Cyclotella cf. meneghiniana]
MKNLLLLLPLCLAASTSHRFKVDYASPVSRNDGAVVWLTTHQCHAEARNVTDGTVLWGRDLCGVGGQSAVVSVREGVIYSFDGTFLRAEKENDGSKLWEANVLARWSEANGPNGFDVTSPRLWSVNERSVLAAVVSRGRKESVVFYDLEGRLILLGSASATAALAARKLLNEAKRKPARLAKIIDVVSSGDRVGVVTGYSDGDEISLSSFAYSEIRFHEGRDDNEATTYEVVHTVPLKTAEVSSALKLSSLRSWADKSKVYIVGFRDYAATTFLSNFDMDTGLGNGKEIRMGDLYSRMLWFDTITVDQYTEAGRLVRLAGQDGRLPKEYRTESLVIVREDDKEGIACTKVSSGDEDHLNEQTEALAYCPLLHVAVAANSENDGTTVLSAYKTSADHLTWVWKGMKGDTEIVPASSGRTTRGLPDYAHLVECTVDSMTVVVTAQGGIAVSVRVEKKDDLLLATRLWTTEKDGEKDASRSDEL